MGHLTDEELIDRLDGGAAAEGHLAACAACRDRLADLRETMAAVADLDVPEPPPAFWPQLSRGVRAAVESDRTPAAWRRWVPRVSDWWMVPAGTAALLVLLTGLVGQVGQVGQVGPAGQVGDTPAIATPDDDPQLALVLDLATGLDWDDFDEAGLAPRVGGVDRAIEQLTPDERVELQRLLSDAIERSGA